MFDILAILSLLGALGLLIALSAIDLKHWILPDKLNLALAIAALVFHFSTGYAYVGIKDMILGACIGAGMLFIIRFFANMHYKTDALGLGDVKLLGAAGLWLGMEGVLMAVTIGAAAGLIHGLVYASYTAWKNKTKFTIHQLAIPAGPGFCIGIAVVGCMMFSSVVSAYLYELFS